MSQHTPFQDYSAKIKEVYVELRDYTFFHSPYSKTLGDARFIGRNKVKERIKSILRYSQTRSGTYLVTGFRGMGKTSVVRQAVAEHNEEQVEKNDAENATKVFHKSLMVAPLLIALYLWLIIAFCVVTVESGSPFDYMVSLVLSGLPVVISWLWWKKSGEEYVKTVMPISVLPAVLFWVVFAGLFYGLTLGGLSIFRDWLGTGDTIFTVVVRLVLAAIISYVVSVVALVLLDGIHHFASLKLAQGGFETVGGEEDKAVEYEHFEINLSQDDLKEIDVLKRINKELLDYWKELDTHHFFPLNRLIYTPWRWLAGLVHRKGTRGDGESVAYHRIMQKLQSLNQRISAEVTAQQERQLTPSFTLAGLQGTKLGVQLGKSAASESTAYPIASSKEIEDELIDIFKAITKLRKKMPALQLKGFIFIIDELDKIDPHNNFNLEEREASNPTLDTLDNAPGSNRIRKRQEAVAQLLGNLKGFLNVVEAKFFFIGGREMFDASLADIADRDSFYSSIFNEVIYVSSFFKDKVDDRAGITQMTEAYLCKVILSAMSGKVNSAKQKDGPYNLQRFYSKLSFGDDGQIYIADKTVSDKWEGYEETPLLLRKAKLYKVVALLQNYVVYLTYRSNGTPKKLASLIEEHIVVGDMDRLKDQGENLVVFHKANANKEKGRLFLRFKFDFQYEIGLTADLYRPYIIANSRHLKSLGDKLLFSSAFIMDHILKFHAFGFSWRNLELIPEVILVNKEPNLRRFIEELIRFLSHTYIRATVSGLFQYRFYSKTARELMYLSKTSDLGAAAFNFTLDESLQIKRHYKRKLMELRSKYAGYEPVDGDNQFVHSLCFVQTILGDLYFYDKEYDEAVIYYTESIQTVRLPSKIKTEQITRHQLYLWVRNKLKLGLTLEKMRAFNSAFSGYRTLILDLEKSIRCVVDYWAQEDKGEEFQRQAHSHRTIQLLAMPFVAFLGIIEKMRSDGITAFNLQDQEQELDTLINSLEARNRDHYRGAMLKADYYNNVGSLLFYKNCHFPSLYQSEWEIQGRKLNPKLAVKHRVWIRQQQTNNPVLLELYQQFKALYRFKKKVKKEEGINSEEEKKREEKFDFHPSLSGLNYYLKSCAQLLGFHKDRLTECLNERIAIRSAGRETEIKPLGRGLVSILPGFLLPECIDFINTKRFYHLGSITSKLGDTILGSLEEMRVLEGDEENGRESFLQLNEKGEKGVKAVLALVQRLNQAELAQKPEDLPFFSLQQIIDLYELSAAFYRRAGRMYSYAFQYKKILYLVKDFVSLVSKEEVDSSLALLLGKYEDYTGITNKLEQIAEEIFRSVTWNYDVSNRPQVLKYRQIFNHENRGEDSSLIYNSLNNVADCREAILLVEEIKMKLRKMGISAKKDALKMDNLFISPYSMISHRFIRILELKFRSEWYYYVLKDLLGLEALCSKPLEKYPEHKQTIWKAIYRLKDKRRLDSINKFLPPTINFDPDSYEPPLRFLISEAIFCLRELIKTVRLYEPGYIIGFSYLGAAHRKMGFWCQAYENLCIFWKEEDTTAEEGGDLRQDIINLVGKNALVYLEPNYHFEIAVQNYYRAIQMHTEGRAYKAYILNLYLLEDDFNDNLTHFSLAMERMRVNLGNVRQQIKLLQAAIKGAYGQGGYDEEKGSRLHRYSSYYPVVADNTGQDNNMPPIRLKYYRRGLPFFYRRMKYKTYRRKKMLYNAKRKRNRRS